MTATGLACHKAVLSGRSNSFQGPPGKPPVLKSIAGKQTLLVPSVDVVLFSGAPSGAMCSWRRRVACHSPFAIIEDPDAVSRSIWQTRAACSHVPSSNPQPIPPASSPSPSPSSCCINFRAAVFLQPTIRPIIGLTALQYPFTTIQASCKSRRV
ncbi:hypothetical protein BC628DRAFT_236946 [Trametes gibbosa]|nr:hypothetical protein BC628DRAFT_236946 [Trametes gibbosa]